MRRRPLIAALPGLAAAGRAFGEARPVVGRAAHTLRLALIAPLTSLDPPQTNTDANTNEVIAQILEAPLCFDYLARPVAMLPATAEALPEVSPDGRVFTVHLQPGTFFADDPAFGGRPRELVAADYVYSIKRFYDPRYDSSDLYLFESAALPGLAELRHQALAGRRPFDYDTEVEGVRALDRYTLRITLGRADPRFVWLLANPALMGAVAREVVAHYGDDIGAHPVGTGAFRLARWRRGSRVELERSKDYRGSVYAGRPAAEPLAQAIAADLRGRRLPRVERIVLDIVEEEQPRWLSFLDGSYDWLNVPGTFLPLAAPGGRLAPYLARRGIAMQQALQPDIRMHFFFMQDPLVGGYTPGKVALRRAIGLAFDGDAYLRDICGGFGVPAQSTVPPFTSGYDPGYRSEMSEHSPPRAMALLDLFGYVDRDGDGWREQPDGRPLVLRMASTPTQLDRRTNELWQRAMNAVGLKMVFEVGSWPQLLDRSRAGTLMMWGYRWSANSPDGGFFLGIAYGPNAGQSNDPRFELAAFDGLFERQRALPDGPARDALMRQAKNLLVAYLPFKVHAHDILVDLVQPWTRGYWRHPFMIDTWRFIDTQPEADDHG